MNKNHALLVIDMQNGFLNETSPLCIPTAKATVPACAEAIRWARGENIPIFFVTRRYSSDGSDVEHTRYMSWFNGGKPLSPGCAPELSADMPEEFGVSEDDYHIVKPSYSAFFRTELDEKLREFGIGTVILAGATTPNCIRMTCYDAISLGYNVGVLSDCTSSVTEEIQESNLRDMENVGAQILSSEEWMSGTVQILDTARIARECVRTNRGSHFETV